MANIPSHIELLAGQLLPRFIPKNENETTLSFQFTVAPNDTYRVTYAKTAVKGKMLWQLTGCEEVRE